MTLLDRINLSKKQIMAEEKLFTSIHVGARVTGLWREEVPYAGVVTSAEDERFPNGYGFAGAKWTVKLDSAISVYGITRDTITVKRDAMFLNEETIEATI